MNKGNSRLFPRIKDTADVIVYIIKLFHGGEGEYNLPASAVRVAALRGGKVSAPCRVSGGGGGARRRSPGARVMVKALALQERGAG